MYLLDITNSKSSGKSGRFSLTCLVVTLDEEDDEEDEETCIEISDTAFFLEVPFATRTELFLFCANEIVTVSFSAFTMVSFFFLAA